MARWARPHDLAHLPHCFKAGNIRHCPLPPQGGDGRGVHHGGRGGYGAQQEQYHGSYPPAAYGSHPPQQQQQQQQYPPGPGYGQPGRGGYQAGAAAGPQAPIFGNQGRQWQGQGGMPPPGSRPGGSMGPPRQTR
jgi:hypothetical protein